MEVILLLYGAVAVTGGNPPKNKLGGGRMGIADT